ncbi:MAG: ABC transporter permease [Candidatus Atribacteria bacterium]|nr:ABC transporter permease [Candidatus Atribacteria bacterium]
MKVISQRMRAGKPGINVRILLLIVVLVGATLFFGIRDRRFLAPLSISSIAFQCPEIGFLGLGMALTMIVGGVNLSINDTANLSALVAGLFLLNVAPILTQNASFSVGIAVIISLGIGILCGVVNGFLIGYVGAPPILVTLATLTLYRGISVVITGGKSLTGFQKELALIGHGVVGGIPISFLLFIFFIVAIHMVLERTSFGFKVRMVGTNYLAAKFSGIHNKLIILRMYILSGFLGAIAGIIIMSRTNSVAYEYGTRTYILLTLLISVLGGISPGFGSVFGIFLATLILQVLSTGFQMVLSGIRGSAFFKDFSWGVIFILFLIIDRLVRSLRK